MVLYTCWKICIYETLPKSKFLRVVERLSYDVCEYHPQITKSLTPSLKIGRKKSFKSVICELKGPWKDNRLIVESFEKKQ